MAGFGKRKTGKESIKRNTVKSEQRKRDEKLVGNVLFYGALGLLGAITLGYFLESSEKTPPAGEMTASIDELEAPTVAQKKAKSPLWLISSRCRKEHGFVEIVGKVKNESDQAIDNLMALGSFHDTGDELVKTASAMVEFQPLLPGQESPFTVMTTDNPAISTCVTHFKTMLGGMIPYDH